MIPWRLLVGLVVVLLIVSVFLTNFGGVSDKVRSLLKGTPFSGLVSSPDKLNEQVDVKLYLDYITLKSESQINVTSGETILNGFVGILNIDFINNSLELVDSTSGLHINLPLGGLVANGFSLPALELNDVKYELVSGKLITKSDNGTIKLLGFYGDVMLYEDHASLVGNVSQYITPA